VMDEPAIRAELVQLVTRGLIVIDGSIESPDLVPLSAMSDVS
jgi:hypothetical protein